MIKLLLTVLIALTVVNARAQNGITPVVSDAAPKAIGPYSQAIKTGNLVYTSGQIGLVPSTGALAGNDIAAQTHQALRNLKAVVERAGSDMEHVVKVTIFLKDMDNYTVVNDIYKDYFPGTKPARSTVQVVRLPKDALIEIECVAELKK